MRRAWVLVAAALGGCPQRPLDFGTRGELVDPTELLAALAARSQKLNALEAEATVSARSEQGGGTTNGLIAAERPDSLKIELDDFFGNPAAVLTADGKTLGVYSAKDAVYGEGAASPRNVAKLVSVELPVSEVVDLLLGDPRPLAAAPRAFFVDRVRRSYAVRFEAGGRRQRIDLDISSWLPIGVAIEGQYPYLATFADAEQQTGLSVPKRVEIEGPGAKASVHYRSVDVHPTLPAGFFAPAPPAGAKRVQFPE